MSTVSMEGPFYHILSIMHEEERRDAIKLFCFQVYVYSFGK